MKTPPNPRSLDLGSVRHEQLRKRAEEALARGEVKRATELFGEANLSAAQLLHELNVHQTELEMQADELRSVNDRLQDTLRYTRQLFQGLPQPAMVVDQFGLIRSLNAAAEEQFGLRRQNSGRQTTVRSITADVEAWGQVTAALGEAYTRGRSYLDRLNVVGPAGEPRVAQLRAFHLDPADDEADPEILLTLSDVTEVFRATQRYEGIVHTVMDAIMGVDRHGVVRLFNPAACRVFGMMESAAIGRPLADFFPEDEPGQTWDEIQLQGNPSVSTSERPFRRLVATRANLERFPAEVSVSPFESDSEGVRALVVRDLSVSERLESALQESEARFRQVTGSSTEMFWLLDVRKGLFLYTSPATASVWGLREGAEGLAISEMLARTHPDDRDAVRAFFTNRQRTSREVAHRVLHDDGTERWLSHRSAPVREGEGAEFRVAGVTADITNERADSERIRLLESSVAHLNDAVLIASVKPGEPLHLQTVFINRAFTQLTGYTAEEVLDQEPAFMLQHAGLTEDQAEARDRIREAVVAREPVRTELILPTRRGETLWAELILTPLHDTMGVCTHFTGVMRDITRRKAEEQERSRAQRLQSLGQLTGGVAHDFNNLLTVVLGNADELAELVSDPEQYRMAEMIRSSAEKAADLTRRLLTFARRQPLAPEETELDPFLHDFAPFVRRSLGELYQIQVDTPERPISAMVDITGLEAGLLNLCINSRDAMPRGGTIRLTLSLEALHEPAPGDDALAGQAHLDPGHYAVIRVEDEGEGIPDEILDNIFDPFFTTKGMGKGTGLGLASLYGFMRQSGGDVRVKTQVGEGTTFTLYLPAVVGDAADEAVDEAAD